MYLLDSNDEFNHIHYDDLWVYNKLQLSRCLGYVCGPTGSIVPKPDFYIIRPSINFLGMGRFARIEWIEKYTDIYHPSEFWCQIFKGEHLSVDFKNQKSELVVRGTKKENSPLYKWEKWEKININIEFPKILRNLRGNYEWINCEFIDGNLIEVHFRQNPDFRYGNKVAIPVWEEKILDKYNNFQYIDDPDYKRKGFYIK